MLQPNIISVQALEDYRLLLQYENNELRIFDMKPYLHLPFYKPLTDISIFKTVRPVDNGWTIEWINGCDFPPEDLYNKSVLTAA